jgi:hypothetical protein
VREGFRETRTHAAPTTTLTSSPAPVACWVGRLLFIFVGVVVLVGLVALCVWAQSTSIVCATCVYVCIKICRHVGVCAYSKKHEDNNQIQQQQHMHAGPWRRQAGHALG